MYFLPNKKVHTYLIQRFYSSAFGQMFPVKHDLLHIELRFLYQYKGIPQFSAKRLLSHAMLNENNVYVWLMIAPLCSMWWTPEM